jgi:cytochrome c-type biogenesis protein CcmH/NrfG
MQPISLLVAVLLGLVTLAYVLYPLYRHPTAPGEATKPSAQQKLSEREQNARQALQEVEFDFQLGNLDEGDYRSLRTRYMRRALAEMKQRLQREQEIDEEIEEQLRKLKEAERHEVEYNGQ